MKTSEYLVTAFPARCPILCIEVISSSFFAADPFANKRMGPKLRGLVARLFRENRRLFQPMRSLLSDDSEIKLIIFAIKPRKKLEFTKLPSKHDFLLSEALHCPKGHFGRNEFYSRCNRIKLTTFDDKICLSAHKI